jgi:rsbT co-antagonist protein RsbR
MAEGEMTMDRDQPSDLEGAASFPTLDQSDEEQLLPQLVAHLREHRENLRQEWAKRIQDSHLLAAMTPQEMGAETTSVYDNYVGVLETGSV